MSCNNSTFSKHYGRIMKNSDLIFFAAILFSKFSLLSLIRAETMVDILLAR